MSKPKRSAALLGIEVRADAKGQKRYRGTARDKIADRHLRGPWTGSLAAARAWRVDALARLQAGTLSADAGPTVAEASERFITGMKSGSVRQRGGHTYKPSAIRGYERDLRNHAVPVFGPTRLGRVQRPDLQRWVDMLAAGDRAPSTVKNIVAALRALISWGELQGWVRATPCQGLRLPSGETDRDRIASPAEAEELIAAMRPTDQAAMGFAVYAGLRLGEILALDVRAVDLDAGWVIVRRGWDKGVKAFIPTKSRQERRVPIIEKLAVLLRDHFTLLDHPADGLLFPSAKRPEWPTDPGVLRRRNHDAWEKEGMTPLGFHEARHTFASISIAAGLNVKTLSTYMGHATITITLDRYGHLMPGSEVEARTMLDSYLAKSG